MGWVGAQGVGLRKRTHGMGRSGIGIFGVGGAGLARVRRRGGEQRGGASREHGLRMACDSIYLNIYTLMSISYIPSPWPPFLSVLSILILTPHHSSPFHFTPQQFTEMRESASSVLRISLPFPLPPLPPPLTFLFQPRTSTFHPS